MAFSDVEIAKGRQSVDARDAEFMVKFGHAYLKNGYHGHWCYSYNCRECGIHISLITPGGWPESEKHGKFPGRELGSRRG